MHQGSTVRRPDEGQRIIGFAALPTEDFSIAKTLGASSVGFAGNTPKKAADAAKKLGLAPPNYYRMAKELGLKKSE